LRKKNGEKYWKICVSLELDKKFVRLRKTNQITHGIRLRAEWLSSLPKLGVELASQAQLMFSHHSTKLTTSTNHRVRQFCGCQICSQIDAKFGAEDHCRTSIEWNGFAPPGFLVVQANSGKFRQCTGTLCNCGECNLGKKLFCLNGRDTN
jgi:hypothetical protein